MKTWLESLSNSIKLGASAPGILLPAEIDSFPELLVQRVAACDDVVVWFFGESLRYYKAGSTAGAAFMLGAASEKAVLILIYSYTRAISDSARRAAFEGRTNNRMISNKYDESQRSYKSAKTKSAGALAQDLDQLLDGAFNFYRYTRNAVGHPQIIPDLDQGAVLANIGQFIVYIERIYSFIDFFNAHPVEV